MMLWLHPGCASIFCEKWTPKLCLRATTRSQRGNKDGKEIRKEKNVNLDCFVCSPPGLGRFSLL